MFAVQKSSLRLHRQEQPARQLCRSFVPIDSVILQGLWPAPLFAESHRGRILWRRPAHAAALRPASTPGHRRPALRDPWYGELLFPPGFSASPPPATGPRWQPGAHEIVPVASWPAFPCPSLAARAARIAPLRPPRFDSAALHEALVVARQQMSFDLPDSIDRNADDDQQRSATEIKWNVETLDQKSRQYANGGDVECASERNPRQDSINIIGGIAAR